jgi:choline dehydrogenase-like flavoprotein
MNSGRTSSTGAVSGSHSAMLRTSGGSWVVGKKMPDRNKLENLSIHDGSIFPTSIGANPQLSIYGTVNRLAQGFAKRLASKEVTLA